MDKPDNFLNRGNLINPREPKEHNRVCGHCGGEMVNRQAGDEDFEQCGDCGEISGGTGIDETKKKCCGKPNCNCNSELDESTQLFLNLIEARPGEPPTRRFKYQGGDVFIISYPGMNDVEVTAPNAQEAKVKFKEQHKVPYTNMNSVKVRLKQ